MSHFLTLVIGKNVEKQLAPFHEFECTGHDDEFVQDVDITDEAIEKYESDTTTKLQDSNGDLHDPYDDRFYRDPTAEEIKELGPFGGSGYSAKLKTSYRSQDWGDGRGYRVKIKFIPDDFKEVELSTKDVKTLASFVECYYGYERATSDSLDLSDKHKYGYCLVDDKDNVLKIINRTNPNAKWDWYIEGGRYEGRLITKDGEKVNSCLKKDLDLDAMLASRIKSATDNYNNGMKAFRTGKDDASTIKFLYDFDPEKTTLEEYLKDVKALSAYAVVKDGEWYEKGEMGWFGMASNEMSDEEWTIQLNKLLDEISDDTLITVIDCHI